MKQWLWLSLNLQHFSLFGREGFPPYSRSCNAGVWQFKSPSKARKPSVFLGRQVSEQARRSVVPCLSVFEAFLQKCLRSVRTSFKQVFTESMFPLTKNRCDWACRGMCFCYWKVIKKYSLSALVEMFRRHHLTEWMSREWHAFGLVDWIKVAAVMPLPRTRMRKGRTSERRIQSTTLLINEWLSEKL